MLLAHGQALSFLVVLVVVREPFVPHKKQRPFNKITALMFLLHEIQDLFSQTVLFSLHKHPPLPSPIVYIGQI